MKNIILYGHERAITQIKYNRNGDLIFTAAKDKNPNIWYTVNGERLGTFDGHNGAVWCIDVDLNTTNALTGSADNTCKIWNCETGKNLNTLKTKNAVRSCGFYHDGNTIMYSTDNTMGYSCEIHIFDIRDHSQIGNNKPAVVIPVTGPKITSAIWGPYEKNIIAGHENGIICNYEIEYGTTFNVAREHNCRINDLQISPDSRYIISASNDKTAKLFTVANIDHINTYKSEQSVNSASISPLYKHVVIGGGQESKDVSTTKSVVGNFEANFYYLIFGGKFGRVKGHFGPINSISFNPDGKSYSSGGEDGYVRMNYFDKNYFELKYNI